jgi:hypothetical protein
MGKTDSPTLTGTPRNKVGGNYTAIDNGDGTFEIKDLPIFAEVPAGERRNEKAIGRKWMAASVIKNKEREAEGHLPPVHLHHHDDGVTPSYAGKMRLKSVKQIKYEGRLVWAVFADIIEMPEYVFEQVQKGFVPYRSVEVHSWDDPEIDSLALMPTEVPFFRMAMTTVGEVKIRRDTELFTHGTKVTPALYCREAGASSLILFNFKDGGSSMADQLACKKAQDDDEKKKPVELQEDEEKKDEKMGELGEAGNTAKPEDKVDSDVKEPTKVDQLAEQGAVPPAPPAAPAPPVAAGPPPWVAEITNTLQQIAQVLGVPAGGAGAPQTAAPAQNMTDKKGDVMAQKPDEVTLRGEVAALKLKDAARDKAEAKRVRKAKALKALDGYNVTEELDKELDYFAEKGDEDLDKFVAVIKRTNPRDPEPDVQTFATTMEAPDAEFIEKFTKDNPNAMSVKEVHGLAATYKQYKAASGSDITFERFVAAHQKAEAEKIKEDK